MCILKIIAMIAIIIYCHTMWKLYAIKENKTIKLWFKCMYYFCVALWLPRFNTFIDWYKFPSILVIKISAIDIIIFIEVDDTVVT